VKLRATQIHRPQSLKWLEITGVFWPLKWFKVMDVGEKKRKGPLKSGSLKKESEGNGVEDKVGSRKCFPKLFLKRALTK
jgi:hypothetical protein